MDRTNNPLPHPPSDNNLRVPGLDLALDSDRWQVTRGNQSPVDLAGKENPWGVLVELAKRWDKYCSKRHLIEVVWGGGDPDFEKSNENTLFATVSNLRNALKRLGLDIKYRQGLGYRLEALRHLC